jgi:hypothetical protein
MIQRISRKAKREKISLQRTQSKKVRADDFCYFDFFGPPLKINSGGKCFSASGVEAIRAKQEG